MTASDRVPMVRWVILGAIWSGLVGGASSGAERVRFNRDVLPILADHCFACHGFDAAKRAAGLRLDQRESATRTLESGQRALVPGRLADSYLWTRVTSSDPDLRMPPAAHSSPLTAEQQEVLRRWIEEGAEYEPHWAWLPPRTPALPAEPASGQPLDRFVRARLRSVGLEAAPEADRATLIRRLSLDLTGLPPSPADVEAFVNDRTEDAWERLVDRLLNSVHYGERWARWWLDLAHYGDSDGYLQDFLRPVAWRYRQWVVDALNRDLPFDRFTIEQLAGDLLPEAGEWERMGTGFLRNTLSNREGGADLEEYRVNQVLDRTTTLGATWLALTTGCAQCHDHKFDPFTQREFYGLYAFFNRADEVNINAPLPGERQPWEAAKREYDRQRAALLAPVAERLQELQADWERRLLHAESHPGEDFSWDRALELIGLQWGQNLGEGQLEGLNIIKTPGERRTADQRDRLLDYFLSAAHVSYAARLQEIKADALRQQLDALAKQLPPVTRAPAMERSVVPRTTQVLIRGEYQRRGDVVTAGTPAFLPPLTGSGEPDRLALARWLVAPEHPLTARVAVNRLWQELFGRGLVGTADNFGVRGERPTHPELLDWLAVRFREDGWSVKRLLRTIILSETYRQSSHVRPELLARDPLNRLLARQVRLRLSGELVRDTALASSGLLNRKIGGPSVKPPQPASVSLEGYSNSWEPSPLADRYRRGLYTFLQRTSPFAQLVTFDLPDLSRSCARRERSNTPLQALQLLNDPVFFEAAQALAERVIREGGDDDAVRLECAFGLTLARRPTAVENRRLLAFLAQQRAMRTSETPASSTAAPSASPTVAGETGGGGRGGDGRGEGDAIDPAWVSLASVLLNLDEFITRE